MTSNQINQRIDCGQIALCLIIFIEIVVGPWTCTFLNILLPWYCDWNEDYLFIYVFVSASARHRDVYINSVSFGLSSLPRVSRPEQTRFHDTLSPWNRHNSMTRQLTVQRCDASHTSSPRPNTRRGPETMHLAAVGDRCQSGRGGLMHAHDPRCIVLFGRATTVYDTVRIRDDCQTSYVRYGLTSERCFTRRLFDVGMW